jgi:hypothetical protein
MQQAMLYVVPKKMKINFMRICGLSAVVTEFTLIAIITIFTDNHTLFQLKKFIVEHHLSQSTM